MASRQAEINKLRAEIEALGNRLMELTEETAGDVIDEVTDYVEDSANRFSKTWGRVRQAGHAAGTRAQNYAEENPWHVMAMGAAVGLAIGYMLRGKRD